MPGSIEEIIRKLSEAGDSEDNQRFRENLEQLQLFLQGQEEIRVFLSNAYGSGHQGTTIRMMLRLIELGYVQQFTLCCENLQASNTTIKCSLPDYVDAEVPFSVIAGQHQATVVVIQMPKTPLPNGIKFGFVCGLDIGLRSNPPQTMQIMRTNLAVEFFLVLQPYEWKGGGAGYKLVSTDAVTDLAKLTTQLLLQQRVFCLDDPPEPDWDFLENARTWQNFPACADMHERVSIAQALVTRCLNTQINLLPTYGWNHWDSDLNWISGACINISSGIIKVQTESANHLPTVVLLISVADANLTALHDLLDTGPNGGANSALYRLANTPCQVWMNTNVIGTNKLKVLRMETPDPTTVIQTLDELQAGQILVINLMRLPQVVYDFVFSRANFPAILEGQGSMEQILNSGRPYFKIGDKPGYPTLPLSSVYHTGGIEKDCWDIASRGIISATPLAWSNDDQLQPPFLITRMIAASLGNNDDFSRYFTELREFFHNDQNDKLLLALFYLVDKSNDGNTEDVLAMQLPTTAIDEETPLEKLYNALYDHLQNGEIDFLKAITTGLFYSFFAKLVSNSIFELTSATLNIDEEKTKVTLDGTTEAFGLGKTEVGFAFTSQDAGLQAVCTVSFKDARLDFPGTDWLSMSSPGMKITLNEGSILPVQAALTLRMQAGVSMDVALYIPAEESKYLLQAEFEEPKPGISSIFQAIGGINLDAILPSQISLLTDIEVDSFTAGYDHKNNTVSYINVHMSTPTGSWPLLPSLDVTGLVMLVVVTDPGNVSKRQTSIRIDGDFTIGNGTGYITAQVPQLIVSGGLKEDSEPVSISQIIKAYLGSDILLPSAIENTSIEKLNFSLDKGLDIYSFACAVSTNWPVPPAPEQPLFTITGLGFNIEGSQQSKTGSFTGSTIILPESQKIGLSVTANYGGADTGWTFTGQQTSGVIPIGKLLKEYLVGWETTETWNIDGFGLTIETKTKSYEFTAKTAEPWQITPLDLSVSASVKLGRNSGSQLLGLPRQRRSKAEMPALIINRTETLLSLVVLDEKKPGPYGEISAEIKWNEIDLLVSYNFNPDVKSFEVTWGILTGKIEKKDVEGTPHQIATLKFTQSTTLGSMIEIMVSWATGSKFSLSAPWDLLNKIPLSNFELIWDFTDNTVTVAVNIGPIDLGIATIKSIGLAYDKDPADPSRKRVMVKLSGSFAWQTGSDLAWDATKPETTPAPTGAGSKYLDLRMLAMGQHITFKDFKDITSVQKAIELMAQMPEPKGDEIPAITFDAGSSWLFGADFGVLRIDEKKNEQGGDSKALALADDDAAKYVLTLQTVFNDPTLYALRIAMDGDAAKIFKGLDFQIMYLKLSDTLGVYSAEITLPDVMRRMTVGAYTVTLPVFGIQLYTNGDFRIDIGFPWNQDFSRSFTIEGIIMVGPIPVPVLGAGGLYFGKIPQIAADVPKSSKGHFNPILVFGFGVQIGLGKSIEAGMLKAGFSLTIFGILEGLLAKWNPYDGTSTGDSGAMQLQGEYFFRVKGTFGLIGKLYGSVDFVVIKAEVNITIKAFAQITFASYEPIPISLVVSVEATASLTIDFWLFSITLDFSFSITIKETFTIGALQNPKDAPWYDGMQQSEHGRLSSPLSARLRDHRMALTALAVNETTPVWSNLTKPATPAPLKGFLGLAPTVAGDAAFIDETSGSPDKSKQLLCLVASLFIESTPAASGGDNKSALKAVGAEADTPFETLAKLVARWAIASIKGPMPPEKVDEEIVSDDDLKGLLSYLEGSGDNPTPLPYESIETFLSDQVKMTIADSGSGHAAFFPMALPLILDVPAYGEQPALQYNFGEYNTLASDFISWLRTYFNQLAVQVQQENGNENGLTETLLLNDNVSLAQFVFSDYFILIMKQMLQAMRNGLRTFMYPIDQGDTRGNSIVEWVNETGIAFSPPFDLYDLFEGNADHPLTPNVSLTLSGVAYSVVAGDSFSSIAAKGKFNAQTLATDNAQMAGILKNGQTITYPGKTDYIVDGVLSLELIATKIFNVSNDEFIANSNVLSETILLTPFATLALPPHPYEVINKGDTLNSIASAHGITVKDLADVETNGNIPDLFATADDNPYLNLVHLPQFNVGELIKEAQRTKAIEHLSSMASRYYLHGMRLPTEKITPNKQGMWVTGTEGDYKLPTYAGLFALTGQQFPVPTLATDPLKITLSRPDTLAWLAFDNEEDKIDFTLTPDEENYKKMMALHTYAIQNALDTGLTRIGAESMVESDMAAYPLSSCIPCQVAEKIDYPTGGTVTGDGQPRLWYLPSAMLALPPAEESDNDILPDFTLQVRRYDEAMGTSKCSTIQHFGWGTAIEFTVKRLPDTANKDSSEGAYKTTYEIMGADGTAALLLERMVQAVEENDFSLLTLAYTVQSGGSGSALRIAMGSGVTLGISQVNLSTVTRPPTILLAEIATTTAQTPTLLNSKTEFIRLLWEAGITRNGGFYLYYNEKDQGGLPDSVFNDKGEASLTLLVIYNTSVTGLHAYMNAAMIGDAIDLSKGSIEARAIKSEITYSPVNSDTAAGIAKKYYSSILSLAQNNQEMALSATTSFTLVDGTYQVAPASAASENTLEAIAAKFKMERARIKDVNPRIKETQWTEGLLPGTSIRLPDVPRTVDTSLGGSTLSGIADFYGTSAAAILGGNSNVAGLIAVQNLKIEKGPFTQAGTDMPGVQSIGASRPALPKIPDWKKEPENYAKDSLLYLYTLLGYRIDKNQDFIDSNIGLPLGPKGKPTSDYMDKIRSVKPMSETDSMDYSKGIPYINLICDDNGKLVTVTNPYQANGRLLQIDYSWNDVYGNRLVTQLDEGKKIRGKYPNTPILTGYTDKLIGLSQWPGTSSYWTVTPIGAEPSNFSLDVTISFDPSPYNKPESSTSDAWETRAKASLVTYNSLLNQLTDPNGIEILFKTGLLTAPVTVPASQIGTPTSPTSTLVGWLMGIQGFLEKRAGGDASFPEPAKVLSLSATAPKANLNPTQIFVIDFDFIIRRTDGVAEGDFAAMPAVREIASPITPLTVIKKDGAVVNGAETDPLGLDKFAKNIEDTLSEAAQYTLTIGTGKDRSKANASSSQETVWGVRLGANGNNAIHYSINHTNKQTGESIPPQIFAPRPVSNKLESKTAQIYPYTQVADFDPEKNKFTTNPVSLNFSDIDLDNWVRQFFTSIDNLLSPEYISSMLIIDNKTTAHPKDVTSFMQSFNDQKKKLANVAKDLMSTVYKEQESSRLDSAKEALYQGLLEKLSNLYNTRAAVSFSADVKADEPPVGYDNPQLYGNVDFNDDNPDYKSQVVLTSPKLELVTKNDVPLTFLVEAPALPKSGTSGVLPSLPLKLNFKGTAIEHQISGVPGVEGYKASTWIRLVGEDSAAKLQVPLGTFDIPMFIRSFPATPRMSLQRGTQHKSSGNGLDKLKSWDYSFTYSQDFHYPQDRVYGDVEYNLKVTSTELLGNFPDSFQALAQFISAKPALEKLLQEKVPAISAETDDQTKIDDAAKVLGAFLKMVTDVAHQSESGTGLLFNTQPRMWTSNVDLAYSFHIEEREYTFKPSEEEITAWIVKLASSDEKPPSGLLPGMIPSINIQGWTVHNVPDNDPTIGTNYSEGIYAYWYTDGDGVPVRGDQAQVSKERTLTLPGLDILQRQDAKSTIYLKRNEVLVKGKRSAESFIYQTPEVSFTNPLLPTIDRSEPYDISENTSETGKHELAKYLSNFFTALFQGSENQSQMIQLECQYAYSLNDNIDPFSLPVLLLPPTNVNPKTDFIFPQEGCPPPGQESTLVCRLSNSILNWFNQNSPNNNKGVFNFDLTVMSSMTANPMPLLRLRKLFLEISKISDI